ncbi:MAG: 23S rRNA (pseudouridine(1915)-N(3))-methyltransferase RlmH, partial [Clostridia bacterium]|nr:23S rRNA (pseudouridine(1915)-N(3))-methyltransferase RlmH [Clostridia bacterium]
MQKINIVCVGKIKESFYRSAVDEYLKRLSRFAKVEVKELAEGKNPDDEAESVLRAAKGKIIALCIEGEKYSSVRLANLVKSFTDKGEEASFIIGSSCGLSDRVKAQAHIKL